MIHDVASCHGVEVDREALRVARRPCSVGEAASVSFTVVSQCQRRLLYYHRSTSSAMVSSSGGGRSTFSEEAPA
ncbi:predicted protein [Pyrenophora tritici-repentis Pt-1C-BFP]|uniref:Uncharacterized protein n=1 Tax=Pyrenophora tritici-repentis (strain Pt-1C-BFP) TaxID=426418 RepID=B2W5P7_PYRTR|nr:uncharacterized protein PTRG_06055 [Pyrenophora tritici-repentis Pt-1C-BFP]EDU48975.1 predicted protein [Pyrenophora tritici-repentis Pt-1C-BFP]